MQTHLSVAAWLGGQARIAAKLPYSNLLVLVRITSFLLSVTHTSVPHALSHPVCLRGCTK